MLLALIAMLAAGIETPQTSASASAAEKFYTLGVAQYQDGEFDAAVFTLDTAIRRLGSADPKRLAQAHLVLGASYVQLHNNKIAQAKFRKALSIDREARLDPAAYPPRLIQVLQAEVDNLAARGRGGGAFSTRAWAEQRLQAPSALQSPARRRPRRPMLRRPSPSRSGTPSFPSHR